MRRSRRSKAESNDSDGNREQDAQGYQERVSQRMIKNPYPEESVFRIEAPGIANEIIAYMHVFIGRRNARLRMYPEKVGDRMEPRLIGYELEEMSPLTGARRLRLIGLVQADDIEAMTDAILLVEQLHNICRIELILENKFRQDEILNMWEALSGDLNAAKTDSLSANDRNFILKWKRGMSTSDMATHFGRDEQWVRRHANYLRKKGFNLLKRKSGPKTR